MQRAVEAVHATLQAALSNGDPLTIRLGLRIWAALVSPRPLPPCVLLSPLGARARPPLCLSPGLGPSAVPARLR